MFAWVRSCGPSGLHVHGGSLRLTRVSLGVFAFFPVRVGSLGQA